MQLLNGVGPFLCNFVAIPHRANVEKVVHHRVVFLEGDTRGPHRGVAPLLRNGQLHTGRKSAVITLDTLISQVEGTLTKGGEEDLCSGGGEELSLLDQDKKGIQI
jgi:hypothetical protein